VSDGFRRGEISANESKNSAANPVSEIKIAFNCGFEIHDCHANTNDQSSSIGRKLALS
jgi:hypothetical protein